MRIAAEVDIDHIALAGRAGLDAKMRKRRRGLDLLQLIGALAAAGVESHDRTIVAFGVDGSLRSGRLATVRAGAGRVTPAPSAPDADEVPAPGHQPVFSVAPVA